MEQSQGSAEQSAKNKETAQPQGEVLKVSYGDGLSTIFVWQKAFTLMPLWAIPFVPLVGFIASSVGGRFGTEVTMLVVYLLSVCYFFEDLMKRRIKLDETGISSGFKHMPIGDVVAIDVTYKRKKFLPSDLSIVASNGRRLNFRLSALSDESVRKIVQYLRRRKTDLTVVPALNTLARVKERKNNVLDTKSVMEIRYEANRLFFDCIDSIRGAAASWIRVGPIALAMCFSAVWLQVVPRLLVSFNTRWYNSESLTLPKMLEALAVILNQTINSAVQASVELVNNSSSNTFLGNCFIVLLIGFLCFLAQKFVVPNQIIADQDGLSLAYSIGWQRLSAGGIKWSELAKVEMLQSVGGSVWITFVTTNGKRWNLDLSAIPSDYRPLIIKRVEQYAPDCIIEQNVAQTMLPKSNQNYTELWLQSLSQPSERKTMELLQSGHSLANGRYMVLERLGVGGQGTAYLCVDTATESQSQVVLKETLLPLFVDSSLRRKAVEKFDTEAKLLQSLQNDGIVKLTDHFIEDQRAYLVLEYCSGRNLRDQVSSFGAMSEKQVCTIAYQMLDILEYLHGRNVIHRDFTPDNLILSNEQALKLIDFNVAQQQQTKSSGTIVGKHAYLPPEQFRGKATLQSDIYAFGATLFFLLTGADPEPISESSPASEHSGISSAVDAFVRKATALDVSKRYANIDELKLALSNAMDQTESEQTISFSVKTEERIVG